MKVSTMINEVWDWCEAQGFEMVEHVVNSAAEKAANEEFTFKPLAEDPENTFVLYQKEKPVCAYQHGEKYTIAELQEAGISSI